MFHNRCPRSIFTFWIDPVIRYYTMLYDYRIKCNKPRIEALTERAGIKQTVLYFAVINRAGIKNNTAQQGPGLPALIIRASWVYYTWSQLSEYILIQDRTLSNVINSSVCQVWVVNGLTNFFVRTKNCFASGIILPSFKSIGQFYHDIVNEQSYPFRTEGPTMIIQKIAKSTKIWA